MTTVWPEDGRSLTCWNFLTSITDPWNLIPYDYDCEDIAAKVFATIGMIIVTAGLGLIGIIVGASILCHREIQQQRQDEAAARAAVQDTARQEQLALRAAQARRETNELLARLAAETAERSQPRALAPATIESYIPPKLTDKEIRNTQISILDCILFWNAVTQQKRPCGFHITNRIHMSSYDETDPKSARTISWAFHHFHQMVFNTITTLTIKDANRMSAMPCEIAKLKGLKELILENPTKELLEHPDFKHNTQGIRIVVGGAVIQEMAEPTFTIWGLDEGQISTNLQAKLNTYERDVRVITVEAGYLDYLPEELSQFRCLEKLILIDPNSDLLNNENYKRITNGKEILIQRTAEE